MRKASNVIVGLVAAGVCALITYLTIDAAPVNIIYNFCFFGVMIGIMVSGIVIGFLRFRETERGLDRATNKMKSIALNGGSMTAITNQGSVLFDVPYLDGKYQEYLTFLHKTNSPTDIGDYIGEYEINNYTHRRLVEMVPDILTSLGILGTFVGLVLGLRGFNPTSYEAMSGSVESLIDGIKVAFVTSIYGLTLSLAFSYWLRGTLTSVSESLDRFLDAYYTTVVPPTDATAMNHVIANQNSQTKLMQQMQKDLAREVASSLSSSVEPMIAHLNQTMDTFSDVVTCNQEKLLENIGERVARTMKQEFFSEFLEMRKVLGETNKTQREHLETMHAVNEHEQNLTGFVADMQQAMNGIADTSELNLHMTQQMNHLIEMSDDVTDKMMEVAKLSERYTQTLASVQANNADLSEGLSVMNDSNIRMTDQLAAMNEKTVAALEESRRAQSEYVQAANGYLDEIRQAQTSLRNELVTQQSNLREFTDYMTQVLARMESLSEAAGQSLKDISDRVDAQSAEASVGSVSQMQTMEKLGRLIDLMEKRERSSAAAAAAPARTAERRETEEETAQGSERQKKRRFFGK